MKKLFRKLSRRDNMPSLLTLVLMTVIVIIALTTEPNIFSVVMGYWSATGIALWFIAQL